MADQGPPSYAGDSSNSLLPPLHVRSRRVTFTGAAGQQLVGTLDSLLDDKSGGAPTGRNCALLCHGMLHHRDGFFFPALTRGLLQHCSSTVQHVFRFDFSGHGGDSAGLFEYGGYERMIGEIESAVAFLQRSESQESTDSAGAVGLGLNVSLLLGHSMGANCVLMHASRHASESSSSSSSIPLVVAVAPRFDMLVDERFSKADLLRLLRDGVMDWKMPKGRPPIAITIDTYQQRLRVDMTKVKDIDASCRTLLLHGTADEVIPLQDSHRMHHWMTQRCDIGPEGPLAGAKESTLTLKSAASLAPAPASQLAPASFEPPLSAALPHTFVQIPGANHRFDAAQCSEDLCQTICAWMQLQAIATPAASAAVAAKEQGAKL